jgi:AcrR family transcriptional regulator
VSRPRSEDRRNAILSAATRVIATQGLGASTASIAKEASVSNGSLFLYFKTKATLHNELYVSLKTGMATASLAGLPSEGDAREQLRHVWNQWLRWATTNPEKRRTLALLQVNGDITAESHHDAHQVQADITAVFERSRASGPMRDAPAGFALTLTNAIAEAAIDAIIRSPADAETHAVIAFEAIWRVLAGAPEARHNSPFGKDTT